MKKTLNAKRIPLLVFTVLLMLLMQSIPVAVAEGQDEWEEAFLSIYKE